MSLVLKRKNNSGTISAQDDAFLIHSMLGIGVLNSAYNGLSASYNSSTGILTIQSGVLIYGGRQIEVPNGTVFQLDLSSFSSRSVVYIIAEVTISANDAESTVVIYGSTSNVQTSNNPVSGEGTYRLALYKVSPSLGLVTELFTRLKPGVAKNALNLLPDGSVGDESIAKADFWDVFLSDMSGVRYARNADVAAEAQGFVGGAINVVSSDLYMPNRGVYLLQRSILVDRTDSITLEANQSVTYSFIQNVPDLGSRKVIGIFVSTASQLNFNSEFPYSQNKSNFKGRMLESFEIQNGVYGKISVSNQTVTITNNLTYSRTFSGMHIYIVLTTQRE